MLGKPGHERSEGGVRAVRRSQGTAQGANSDEDVRGLWDIDYCWNAKAYSKKGVGEVERLLLFNSKSCVADGGGRSSAL